MTHPELQSRGQTVSGNVWPDSCKSKELSGHLYSALLWDEPIARDAQIWPVLARGSHSFTCHPPTHKPYLPLLPSRRASPALSGTVLIAPTHWRMARLSWPGWLVIYWHRFSQHPDTVTHPSTNRARRRTTWLIETNALTTKPNRQRESWPMV